MSSLVFRGNFKGCPVMSDIIAFTLKLGIVVGILQKLAKRTKIVLQCG